MVERSLSRYFTELPIELAEDIVKLAAYTTSPHHLANIACVCRIFHNWVTPILYESVFLSNALQISLFAATVEQTPRLRPLIRRLCIFLAEKESRSRNYSLAKIRTSNSDDASSSDEGSSYSNDSDSEEDSAMDMEDLILEAEAVSDDFTNASDDVYAVFKQCVHPMPRYEFIFTPVAPAAPVATWRLQHFRPRISRAARFFRPIIWNNSFVDAQSSVILNHCIHLRSLTLIPPGSKRDESAIDTFMLGGIADLTLHLAPLDLLGQNKLHINDYSCLTHLTLLGKYFSLPYHISERAPNITHLRIRCETSNATRDTLINLRHLSHLWLTPSPSNMQSSLPGFLQDLHEKCVALVRVRIDIAPDEGVEEINNALLPFVRVHRYVKADLSWRPYAVWVTPDPNAPGATGTHDDQDNHSAHLDDNNRPSTPDSCSDVGMDPESDSDSDRQAGMRYNVYTERLKEYWMQGYSGGGWDD